MTIWFQVHTSGGHLVARCLHPEDAAAIVAAYGEGAQIRWRGRALFTNGQDGDAGNSYDEAAGIVLVRFRRHWPCIAEAAGLVDTGKSA